MTSALDMSSLIHPSSEEGTNWDSNNETDYESALSDADIERFIRNGSYFKVEKFGPVTQAALIASFTGLIVFGAAGNILVCYVILANRQMRNPRNVLILNLAISDLILCFFTQPFNLMKVSLTAWNLGTTLCKLVPLAAGTNVFVSTISITAIAMDRFQLIVHPTEPIDLFRFGSAPALVFIWIVSALIASPTLVFSEVRDFEPLPGIRLYEMCVENPDLRVLRATYSFASMLIQYIFPIVVVSIMHAQISNRLRRRMPAARSAGASSGHTPSAFTGTVLSPIQSQKRILEESRKRRTSRLLVLIAVVFAASWMPLNIINILADMAQAWLLSIDRQGLIFAVCHLVALGSACLNPVLYGWLNENFRQEFLRVLCIKCSSPCCRQDPVPGSSSGGETVKINEAGDGKLLVQHDPENPEQNQLLHKVTINDMTTEL